MNHSIQRQLEIFAAALDQAIGPQRDAFLTQACAGEESLRQSVEALLAAHEQAGTFLAHSAGPSGPRFAPVTEKPGDQVGRFKLLQQIGEGGCGVVYMAEQEEPVRRRVALKILRLGMDTKTVVARFEAERQALALMDHPNIAKVFDGGATESGRPYFVMELVRGIKITDYCDQAQLTTEERLHLFIQVCYAIQHAHQKGVIHRDIKPSNILVTVNDGVAVPKVIDFGIAKAIDQRLTDKTYFTEFHAFIGTPAYTSPEQAEMSSLDIDTRSDIYSLGVLLYEMLTGQTPFATEDLLRSGLDEMRRIIREEEPVRPSTRLTTMGVQEATKLSQQRQAKLPALVSNIRGDLDWIVMKALEKDRTRRYANSLDFAADIQRHLDNEPVLAGAPSSFYKLQKLVRRNKGAVAAVAAVFLTLLAGLSLTAWQAVRAKQAAQHARHAQLAARHQAEQARTDRDRAIHAEANAVENATVATNALQTAQERLVRLNVAAGWRHVEEGDYFGALLPWAEALQLEEDKPDRAEVHRTRLASVLQQCPKLANTWNVGTNINHLEFTRDGTRLLTASTIAETQAIAQIWEAATGRLISAPMEHAGAVNFLQWSTDESRVVTASQDKTARVWDTATGRPITAPLLHDSPLLQARFSPDGTKLVTLFWVHEETGWSATGISVWDLGTGNMLWRGNTGGDNFPVFFIPDNRLATYRKIHDAATGKVLHNFPWSNVYTVLWPGLPDFAPNFGCAEWNPTRRQLFTYDPNVPRSILRSGEDLETIIAQWDQGGIGRFSANGQRLATANSDSTVRFWNAVTGSPEGPAMHHPLAADLRFSLDGRWLAAASENGTARVWDALSCKPITPLLPHGRGAASRITFSQDGLQLLAAGGDGSVYIWDLRSVGVPRFTWPDTLSGGAAGNADRDGRVVITRPPKALSVSQPCYIWDLNQGETKSAPVWLQQDDIRGLTPTNVITSSYSLVYDCWDLPEGRRVSHSLETKFNFVDGVDTSWSEDGRWLIACYSYPWSTTRSNSVFLFSTLDGESAGQFQCELPVSSANVSPDGKQLAADLSPTE